MIPSAAREGRDADSNGGHGIEIPAFTETPLGLVQLTAGHKTYPILTIQLMIRSPIVFGPFMETASIPPLWNAHVQQVLAEGQGRGKPSLVIPAINAGAALKTGPQVPISRTSLKGMIRSPQRWASRMSISLRQRDGGSSK